jgi:hypothetical protein
MGLVTWERCLRIAAFSLAEEEEDSAKRGVRVWDRQTSEDFEADWP